MRPCFRPLRPWCDPSCDAASQSPEQCFCPLRGHKGRKGRKTRVLSAVCRLSLILFREEGRRARAGGRWAHLGRYPRLATLRAPRPVRVIFQVRHLTRLPPGSTSRRSGRPPSLSARRLERSAVYRLTKRSRHGHPISAPATSGSRRGSACPLPRQPAADPSTRPRWPSTPPGWSCDHRVGGAAADTAARVVLGRLPRAADNSLCPGFAGSAEDRRFLAANDPSDMRCRLAAH